MAGTQMREGGDRVGLFSHWQLAAKRHAVLYAYTQWIGREEGLRCERTLVECREDEVEQAPREAEWRCRPIGTRPNWKRFANDSRCGS